MWAGRKSTRWKAADTTRRQVAAYLGLPRTSTGLYEPVDDEELVQIQEVAHFLAHSDIGNDLNEAQRSRIAAQFQQRTYQPGESIVHTADSGNKLYMIKTGTVEV